MNEYVTYGKEIKSHLKNQETMIKNMVINLRKYNPGLADEIMNRDVRKWLSDEDDAVNSHPKSQSGETAIETLQQVNVKTLNNKKMEQLLESKDIVKEFNEFMSSEIQRILDAPLQKIDARGGKKNWVADYSNFIRRLGSCYRWLKERGANKEDICNYLVKDFIIDTDDEETIRKLVSASVAYNKAMTTLYEQILRENYKLLKIDSSCIEYAIGVLNDDKHSEQERVIKFIKDKIDDNEIKTHFIKKDEGLIDFSDLGGGIIIGARNFKGMSEVITTPSRLLQLSLTYEVVIMTHGMGDRHEDNKWYIEPCMYKGKEYDEVNELLRVLIKDGYKKIFCDACNPFHENIDEDIRNSRTVHVHMSKNTVYAENIDYSKNIFLTKADIYFEGTEFIEDDILYNLSETENELKRLSEAYDIDYYDNKYLIECYNSVDNTLQMLNEGVVWETIKTLAKKFVAVIIAIWKAIVKFFRMVWEKIKEFFGKRKDHSKKKASEPVACSIINCNDRNSQISTFKVSSIEELNRNVYAACSHISSAIRTCNSNQNRKANMYARKLEEIAEKKRQQEAANRNG